MDETLGVTIQMKATEQYFHVVLFDFDTLKKNDIPDFFYQAQFWT